MESRPGPDAHVHPDLSRRRWVEWLLGTSLGAAVLSFTYPILRYLVPPNVPEPSMSEFELDVKAGDIAPNSGRIVAAGGKPVLLFRTAGGELKALTAICTHLACTVQYRPDRSDIWCACHNGVYSTAGANVSGPPPRALTALQVNVRGDKVIVRRV